MVNQPKDTKTVSKKKKDPEISTMLPEAPGPAGEEISIENTFRLPTDEDKAKEDRIKNLVKAAKDMEFAESHPDYTNSIRHKMTATDKSELNNGDTVGYTGVGENQNFTPVGQDDAGYTDYTDSSNIPLNPISYDELYLQFFEPITRIYGKLYEPTKKLMLYVGLSNALKYNMIDDIVYHDMRINAMICLQPGAGKRMLKKALMFSELPGKKIITPTSYHPEHFVGKLTWDPKAKATINHHGYLEDDMVIIDEAKDLLQGSHMQQARKYLRVALDPIGSNEVVKATIDVPENLRKRFESAATVVMFLQPEIYPDELATEGDIRRCVMSYFDVPHEMKEQIMNDKILAGRPRKDKQWDRRDQYTKILQGLSGHRFVWDLSLIREELSRYAKIFYEYASSRGVISAQVADDAYFDTILHLIRFSCCRAACEGKEQPTLEHLRAAYNDFWIFYQQMVDFCVKLLPGKFVTIATRKISTQDYEKIHEAINWLAEQGAISPVLSRITSKIMLDWMVSQSWGGAVGNGGSSRIWKLMKEHGFVEFQRRGYGIVLWIRQDNIPEQWKEELRGSLVPQ